MHGRGVSRATPRVQGDGKSVDEILNDGDHTLHFAIGRWPTDGPELEPAAESEEIEPEIEWAERQGVGPEEDGYGQAVGMCWNGAGLPKVFARFFGRLSSGKPDGFGRLELEEGGIYMGAVANGKQHGMGQLTCPNGDRYWGTWEAGCFGQVGGGVGVWHFAGEDQAVHGLWYEAATSPAGEETAPGLMGSFREDDPQTESCYAKTEAAVKSAEHAVKLAGEAVMKQHASANSDQALRQGVGQRAYETLSLRQLFPPGSSAVAEGGLVERLERRAATAPAQREGGVNGAEHDTHLLKHKIAKCYAKDRQTSRKHEGLHLGSNAKATCSPTVPGATTVEEVHRQRRRLASSLAPPA